MNFARFSSLRRGKVDRVSALEFSINTHTQHVIAIAPATTDTVLDKKRPVSVSRFPYNREYRTVEPTTLISKQLILYHYWQTSTRYRTDYMQCEGEVYYIIHQYLSTR